MRKVTAIGLALAGALVLSSAPLRAGSEQAGQDIARILASPDRPAADRERDARSHPEAVLPLLNLGRGDRVADIFAGAGYYSDLLGRLVGPGGKVLLHNNRAYASFVGEALDQRFAGSIPPAVVRHDREVDDLDLGEGELDAVMIIMSYHDLYHTAEGWPAIDVDNFMGQIVAALKPGGRFLLVDHIAADGTGKGAAQDLHRIEQSFVEQDVARFGLKLAGHSDALRNPDDDHSASAFAPEIRGKTDRFVLVFEK